MEVKEIFEAVVRNGIPEDLDGYCTREFSFETVFSIYSYSYCCCPCAFEHEFVDYIKDDGINETMFERIKGNIARGKCEHVDGAIPKYVHKTRVHGQHIVVARGIQPKEYREYESSIFRVYPYMIAIMKKHSLIAENFIQHLRDEAEDEDDFAMPVTRLMYANRSIEKTGFIEIWTKQITEICASMKDPLLFTILDPDGLEDFDQQLSGAFEILSQDKSSDMFKRMSDFVSSNGYSCGSASKPVVDFGSDVDHNLNLEFDMALNYHNIREALEKAIYENADVDQNTNSVRKALAVDETILEEEIFLDSFEMYIYGGIHDIGYYGAYLMDGLEHSPYGHEGKYFALNFAAPLLLECGYHVDDETLHKALDKKLHDKELQYLRRYSSNPDSLKMSCCKALREKFKGKAIHEFVKAANLPETISDLILFKRVLKTFDIPTKHNH